jgi:Serine dehydrogenase proteinase
LASTWAKVLEEVTAEQKIPGPKAPWARVLARKIKAVVDHTKRPLVIYGSGCTTSGKQYSPQHLQIDPSDKIGFHDVLEGLAGPNVDIVLHSPGGFAEAAEAIVEAIRQKFSHVRFIVPSYAKSAATMMAMAGDEILLEDDAELGPIDPQMLTQNGVVAAEAIKEQFQKASADILQDQKKLSIWIPILQPMGPALLVQCDNAIDLSKRLVREWLTKYMFKGQAEGATKADKVATYLSTHANFKSHARPVKLEHLAAANLELNIKRLRDDTILHTAVWELYCTMDIVFANLPIYKLFYNSIDDAIVRTVAQP